MYLKALIQLIMNPSLVGVGSHIDKLWEVYEQEVNPKVKAPGSVMKRYFEQIKNPSTIQGESLLISHQYIMNGVNIETFPFSQMVCIERLTGDLNRLDNEQLMALWNRALRVDARYASGLINLDGKPLTPRTNPRTHIQWINWVTVNCSRLFVQGETTIDESCLFVKVTK